MFSMGLDPNKEGRYAIHGVPSGHDARVLIEIAARLKGQLLIHVALDDIRAALLTETINFFSPATNVISFPSWDCLPYDRLSPQGDIVSARISALNQLRSPIKAPTILMTTVNAIIQKTLPPDVLDLYHLTASRGVSLPLEKLRSFLAINGYVSAGTVREPGEFAVRGGIVDIFPPGYEFPLRLDYDGDDIDAIRIFDPLTQTTTDKIDSFSLSPISEAIINERTVAHFRSAYRELFGAVTENDPLYNAITAGRKFPGIEHWLGLFYPKLYSLFDYLPGAALCFDYQSDEALKSRYQQIEDFYQARLSLYQSAKRSKTRDHTVALYKPAPVSSLYLKSNELEDLYKGRGVMCLSPFSPHDTATTISARGVRGRDFSDARTQNEETNLYEIFKTYIVEQQSHNKRVLIACYSRGSADRLASLLKNHDLSTVTTSSIWKDIVSLDPKLIPIVILGLEHGFVSPDLVVVTEQDILGDRLVRQVKKRHITKQFQIELGNLNPGDFIVHAEHGIGRYEGLETIRILNIAHDCVKLIYDGGDKLFVPVENLDVLSRYSSADTGAVLDKLGGLGWQSRKSRVKKRLKDLADALMKIAAERELKKGELITVSEGLYQEFSARFPYPETEDQAKAIADVLDDLGSGKPMDRLICGDVGFGKTEVALRAAFATVESGMQVAVVVPTTLLARQHFRNFSERFKGFPVRIAQLSRMVTPQEASVTRQELKNGQVEIVVGTHSLLGKDVGFKNLGLLVIDEEQHFGVKQKERLKELRAEVHVLTLTATPIPRTLQLSLSGVRELSLITTPPLDRLAVKTFVLPYDPLVVREAIMREHYRGGQSFYVCPRIEDLTLLTEQLKELVPEIKMVMAHGRMSPTELENIMTAFDGREYDLLLATNIIESGLDIPNANTMIIHRADMFGLAQLYQIRGRIGRAKQRGYAYLTYSPSTVLSSTAQQRLEVIQTLDHLGAGFQLASHDMDIRGAGNLLGEEQSGHIREVGIELYQQMLEEAIALAKSGQRNEILNDDSWTPQINLGMSVLIPEDYVSDLNVRLGLYRRLAEISPEDNIDAIAAEMIDRFGPLPQEVENLIQTVMVKQLCKKAGIEKIDAGPKGAVVSFRKDRFSKPDRLIAWITRQSGTVKVRPDQKLVLLRAWDDTAERLTGMQKTLTELVALAA